MKATTELSAHGTWQDPEEVSTDLRADNTLLQVEYGEVAGEWIGHGIVVTLSLINNLEVNEQVLYARMENVEQSTLIS
jgi:3-dehydroquinate synthetase